MSLSGVLQGWIDDDGHAPAHKLSYLYSSHKDAYICTCCANTDTHVESVVLAKVLLENVHEFLRSLYIFEHIF